MCFLFCILLVENVDEWAIVLAFYFILSADGLAMGLRCESIISSLGRVMPELQSHNIPRLILAVQPRCRCAGGWRVYPY
jgi:hypothetical protein